MTTQNPVYASQAKPWLKYYDQKFIDQTLPALSAFEYVCQRSKNHLNDTALEYYGRKFTSADLIVNVKKTAAALRERDRSVTLIFVTNMAQFAVKGYEVDAFDFVVKPVGYSNVALTLQRALNKLDTRRDTEVLVTLSDSMVRLAASQIKYIEISGHRMVYHTTDGELYAYGNLKEVEATLGGGMFARCNNCYLVNLNYVRAVQGHTVTVGTDELQISRPRRKAFIQALNDYLGGGIG